MKCYVLCGKLMKLFSYEIVFQEIVIIVEYQDVRSYMLYEEEELTEDFIIVMLLSRCVRFCHLIFKFCMELYFKQNLRFEMIIL